MEPNTSLPVQSEKKALLREAFVDSIPVFFTYVPLAAVWGLLWKQAGLSVFWGILYSLSIYAGTSQFLAFSFLTSHQPIIALVMANFPLALRNSFYAISFLKRFPKKWGAKLCAAFCLVDAPFAILSHKRKSESGYMAPLLAMSYLYWMLGTVIGVVIADYLPPEFKQLDFALPALITVLIMDQVKKMETIQPSLAAAVFAVVSWGIFGKHWFLPAVGLAAVLSILLPEKKL